MLKLVIYFSAYFYIAAAFIYYSQIRRRTLLETLFLVGVCFIPIGKLFFMPIGGFPSIKMAFFYTSALALGTLSLRFITGIRKTTLFPYLFLLPVFISVIFIYSPGQQYFITPNPIGESDTVALRVISILFTASYACYCVDYVSNMEHGARDIAAAFVGATIFATIIGGIIFTGFFTGQLTGADILRVSVQEVHTLGRIWRFNPGSNVNEFGQIAGYAILMLPWTGWRLSYKAMAGLALACAEFLALTRGAWIGLAAASVVFFAFSDGRVRARMAGAASALVGAVVVAALTWSALTPILVSRTTLSGGVSGDARMDTAMAVIENVGSSPLRALFGYGWSTNMYADSHVSGVSYVHNVPLMLLFDTGVVGVVIYILLLGTITYVCIRNLTWERPVALSLLAFALTVSMTQHNFYHVQTWLIIGLLYGLAVQRARKRTNIREQEIRLREAAV